MPATISVIVDGVASGRGPVPRAVVVLDSKHVGVVDLVRFRLSRRVTLAGATGAAFAPTGPNAYVATRGRDGSRLRALREGLVPLAKVGARTLRKGG